MFWALSLKIAKGVTAGQVLTGAQRQASHFVQNEGSASGGRTHGQSTATDRFDLLLGVGRVVTIAVLVKDDRKLLIYQLGLHILRLYLL
jgi:hypothetical protein